MVDETTASHKSKGISYPLILYILTVIGIPFLAHGVLNLIYSTPSTDFGTGSMFDGIANRYDFLNRALALNMDMSWRRTMVKEITSDGDLYFRGGGKDEVKVLDLATGTADVAILIAKEYENVKKTRETDDMKISSVKIVGVDPSQNMINVGNEKIAKSYNNLSSRINLTVGDARNLLELKDKSFDIATMSFGIRNVPEKEVALCEIHRVLNKKGRLAILEFSEPGEDSGIMGFFARLFIRHIVPVVGAVLSGAPREYIHLQNSIKEFPSPTKFKEMMETLSCGKRGRGAFQVEEIQQLNFGSVQLYLASPVWNN